MRLHSAGAAALAGALATTPAGAAETPRPAYGNGHELLRECTAAVRALEGAALSGEARARASFCRGFVHGASAVVAITEPLKPGGQLFCPGAEGIDRDQAVRAVHEYLLAHPERLHASRITLVTAALIQAWPCPPADPAFHRRMLQRLEAGGEE